MGWLPWITSLLLLMGTGMIRGLEKQWLADVEWRNPNNWLDGRTPEENGGSSRVVFPIEMRHAAGMPRRIESRSGLGLAGIELSRDGILALPEDGKIKLVEYEASSKPQRVSRWLRETPFFWVDPANWKSAASSEATPHLERLPCQGDIVVLPESSKVFSMRLPATKIIEVGGVRLRDENETMPRWDWKAMSDRDEFLGQSFNVKYSPLSSCDNCACQEGDMSEYWEEVCNVQRPRCGLPACEYPLKVEGHCCYYCGGRIRLSKKTLLSTARRVAKTVLSGYASTLSWHARITWDGDSEILVAEKGAYGGNNVVIGLADLQAALKEESVEMLWSETSGGPLYDNRLLFALGPFLGALLVVCILMLIMCPVFGYTYKQVWNAIREVFGALCIDRRVNGSATRRKRKSYPWARFENVSEGNVQIAEEPQVAAPTVTSPIIAHAGGERFENPLYQATTGRRESRDKRKRIETGEPVSLMELERAVERTEDIEMDIESL